MKKRIIEMNLQALGCLMGGVQFCTTCIHNWIRKKFVVFDFVLNLMVNMMKGRIWSIWICMENILLQVIFSSCMHLVYTTTFSYRNKKLYLCIYLLHNRIFWYQMYKFEYKCIYSFLLFFLFVSFENWI